METSECVWRLIVDELNFDTACNNTFWLLEGSTLEENGFKYCPFCGKSINLVMLTDEDQDYFEY